jgi:hypothetical protein
MLNKQSPFTWTYAHTSTAALPIDPREIGSLSQIPTDATYEFDAQGEMRLSGRARPSFAFHWLREVALGVLEAELGLKVASGVEAAVDLRLCGQFRAVISLDDGRWLRLRISKSREQQVNMGTRLSARVSGVTNVIEKCSELMAAIDGVHPMQLITRLVKLAGKGKLTREAVRLGIEETVFKQALQYLRTLEPAAATAVWAALGAGSALAPLVADAEIAGALARIKQHADQTLLGAAAPGEVTRELSSAIISRIPAAIEKVSGAELAWRFETASRETALIDCAFDFTPEGLRLYRSALEGDFTRILTEANEHVRLTTGVLTHEMRREPVIELHLPFVDRKEWGSRLESLARVAVENGADGRILVYTGEAASKLTRASAYQSALTLASAFRVGETYSESSFKLSYTDTQTLRRGEAAVRLAPILAAYKFDERVNRWLGESVSADAGRIESSLTLTVPGSLVEAWLKAPGERDPRFFAVFSRVSVAVQSAMRRAIPFSYFRGLNEYETPGSAYPLLVYQASRPCAGRRRSEFTFDAMDDNSMASVYRAAGLALPRLLERISAMLTAAGRHRTASFYAPRHAANILASVQRNPRLIRSLLVADAFFVGSLVRLGLEGRRLSAEFESDPQRGVKDLSRFTADFVQSYHSRLRYLYAGRDFPALGAMVLVEATAALAGATGTYAPVSAVLRLTDGVREQTFVNAAYRG